LRIFMNPVMVAKEVFMPVTQLFLPFWRETLW
jgi:hypothetical protein